MRYTASSALYGLMVVICMQSGALALEAFSKDPLISGFGKSELKIMLDMAMDNQRPEGFVAGELGAGSGGFTKQVRL